MDKLGIDGDKRTEPVDNPSEGSVNATFYALLALKNSPLDFYFGLKEGNTGREVEILTHDFIKILHAID